MKPASLSPRYWLVTLQTVLFMSLRKFIILILLGVSAATVTAADRFSFFALGNCPYFMPGDVKRVQRLWLKMGNERGDFILHVGNVGDGVVPLNREALKQVSDLFRAAPLPLFYTPGEHCWAAAHRPSMGAKDPLQQLANVREEFFVDFFRRPRDRGVVVHSQSESEGFKEFVENVRFVHKRVVFVSIHVVGGNNNYNTLLGKPALLEYQRRNNANLEWLRAALAETESGRADALVIFCQGNVFSEGRKSGPSGSGYADTYRMLVNFALRVQKPILYIHGEERRFQVDKPVYLQIKDFANNEPYAGDPSYGDQFYGRGALENLTRLQVFGGENVQGAKVTYDASRVSGPFLVEQLIVPENSPEFSFSPTSQLGLK